MNNIDFGAWPAWIALAVSVASPIVHSLIEKRFEKWKIKFDSNTQKSDCVSILMAEIISSAQADPLSVFNFSKDAARAVQYLSPETNEAIIRFAASWPFSETIVCNHSFSKYDLPVYIFHDPQGGYLQDTISSASIKLCEIIKRESTRQEKIKSKRKATT